jgi:hypothetical protein
MGEKLPRQPQRNLAGEREAEKWDVSPFLDKFDGVYFFLDKSLFNEI